MPRTPLIRRAALIALALAAATGSGATANAEELSSAPDVGSDLRLTFERPVVYSGKSHLAWMSPYPFVDKRGETVGLLLRVSNASNAPRFILGTDSDALSVGVETQQGGAWNALPLAACGTGMKPLLVAAGQSFELQVPLPADAQAVRVAVHYRASAEPDPLKGGWVTAYSDAIDVRRWSTHHAAMRSAAHASGGAAPALRGGASGGSAPALRGGASGGSAPALRGGASGGSAPALRGGASNAPAATLPPPAQVTDVQLAFERPTPYSGRTHEAWTTSYAFLTKRGETVGAVLRLTNGTSAAVSVLGFSRDALSIRVEVRGRNGWRGLLIGEPSVGLKPVALAAGSSIEFQVPLPDDARNMRVSIVYRTSDDPDWTSGGWQTVYSDSIDVRRWKK